MQINRIKPCRLTHVTNGSNKHKDTHTRKSEKKEQAVKIQSFMNISQQKRDIVSKTIWKGNEQTERHTIYNECTQCITHNYTRKNAKERTQTVRVATFLLSQSGMGLPSHPLPSTTLRRRPLKSSWGTAVSSPSEIWGRATAKIEFVAF